MRTTVWTREQRIVNTDPERRCYNGCNFSEAKVWSAWRPLYTLPTKEEADFGVANWRAYDMGARKCEWKALPESVAP